MGKATLIYNTNPILTALIAACVLSEVLLKIDVAALFVSFGGIYLMTDMTGESIDQTKGVVLAILASITFSVSVIAMRRLNESTSVNYMVVPFYIAVIGVPFSLSFELFSDNALNISTYTSRDIIFLSIIGVLSITYHQFLSLAFKYEKASRLSPFLYLLVVGGFTADVTIFHIDFTSMDVLGCTVVVVGILAPVVY